MYDLVLPTLGSSGYFQLRAPLDSLISANENYTCQAIRRISEYVANNENVLEQAYTGNGLTETEYEAAIETDMFIVSLQSAVGHWLYVPADYINAYPNTNGVPYRSLMIGASLPPIPANKDLSSLTTSISNLIRDTLGVNPSMGLVETSREVLVDSVVHQLAEADRQLLITNNMSDLARYNQLYQDFVDLQTKLAAAEQYIQDNL